MKMVIVAIKDRAAEAFMRPWFVATVGIAVRSGRKEKAPCVNLTIYSFG